MKMPGRFGRNVISNAGGNAIHGALQIVLLFVLFQLLDDTGCAAFITATYLIGLLEMASDFGGRLWAVREFSVSTTPRSVLSQSLRCKLFYTLASAVLFYLLPRNTLSASGFMLSVLVAATQPGTDPFLWFLRAKERLDAEAVVVLISRVVMALSMITAAVLGCDLEALLVIWLTCNMLRMLTESRLSVVRPLFDGNVTKNAHPLKTFGSTIAATFPVGAGLVLVCLFQRATPFLLEAFATPRDIKIYGTAFKLVNTSGLIATGVFVSSFALLAKAIESNDLKTIKAIIRRKLMLVTIVFLPVCVLGILFSVPVSGMFAHRGLGEVAQIMVLLMPGLYLSCINMGLKYTLNAYALNWHDVAAVVPGIAVLTLVTVFHGSLSWQVAAAVGWGLGEATLLVARLGLLWQQRKHRGVPVGVILGSVAALMLMIVVSR
ncbi:MAG: oligosaccharide flippase family protein [Fuerstiella sp.]|nr:oligosaccharide flippase family protein [Fuerstiella sp.]MCP4854761.1 oligosaccharide flippase family protein [Fuerstiella sp.]